MLVKSCHHIWLSESRSNRESHESEFNVCSAVEDLVQTEVTSPMSSSDTIVASRGDWRKESQVLERPIIWEEAKPGTKPMAPDDDVLLQMMDAMM